MMILLLPTDGRLGMMRADWMGNVSVKQMYEAAAAAPCRGVGLLAECV